MLAIRRVANQAPAMPSTTPIATGRSPSKRISLMARADASPCECRFHWFSLTLRMQYAVGSDRRAARSRAAAAKASAISVPARRCVGPPSSSRFEAWFERMEDIRGTWLSMARTDSRRTATAAVGRWWISRPGEPLSGVRFVPIGDVGHAVGIFFPRLARLEQWRFLRLRKAAPSDRASAEGLADGVDAEPDFLGGLARDKQPCGGNRDRRGCGYFDGNSHGAEVAWGHYSVLKDRLLGERAHVAFGGDGVGPGLAAEGKHGDESGRLYPALGLKAIEKIVVEAAAGILGLIARGGEVDVGRGVRWWRRSLGRRLRSSGSLRRAIPRR